MTMSHSQSPAEFTQHALLVALGEFAQHTGLLPGLNHVKLRQKRYHHSPQCKVVEAFVATLAGLEHLKDISRAAHPLDQDVALARAWGQPAWADASGVSRTLKGLDQAEAEQIVQVLRTTSQVFINSEVTLALWLEDHLVYDGDLTGLAVSKSSRTYPNVGYGHMDDQIRLGYQAALVSLRSPTYGRLWLSVNHHPGNWVSAQSVEEMILGAEASTRVRPRRRTELLEQRLQAAVAYGQSLQQRLAERQNKVKQAEQALQQVQQQIADVQQQVEPLRTKYQEQQRSERPHSQLTLLRNKLSNLVKRSQRRQAALDKARQVLADTPDLIARQQAEQNELEQRLQRLQQDNATNSAPIQAIFRLDAGFGTYENLALLIEMGYEVYTKLHNWKTLHSLVKQVPAQETWTGVGKQASMFAWSQRMVETFAYPLDVGLERFTDGERVKYCALLHFGTTPVCQDLTAWFDFYAHRQTIEAGIKESKAVFQLHRLKVRSEPAIYLQEHFVLFAANFIRWAIVWLAQASQESSLQAERLRIKELVHVAAHTSAEVVRNSEGKLLRFSQQSVFAGKELKLPIRQAFQLPLPLGKSCDFSHV
jgi:hypothetical protein